MVYGVSGAAVSGFIACTDIVPALVKMIWPEYGTRWKVPSVLTSSEVICQLADEALFGPVTCLGLCDRRRGQQQSQRQYQRKWGGLHLGHAVSLLYVVSVGFMCRR